MRPNEAAYIVCELFASPKRNRAAEKTKKRRPDDRLTHWASCQMTMILPNVPVCQALNEKIKSGMERSSRCVTE
ncbi:hypothetical protein H5410_040164 [Solanum commersonii]|uniref:Uncharacterized protein n=1 Tax=Solanum commersonii TaxID=4109 RepID=A0A9J5XPA7_SOLCO|nr:hypothetical protein H5410_040164 [Solanum commersonii]